MSDGAKENDKADEEFRDMPSLKATSQPLDSLEQYRETQRNPFTVDSDEDGISGDDEPLTPAVDADQELPFGSAFKKLEAYDRYLDAENPWHQDFRKPLFPSQVISFH